MRQSCMLFLLILPVLFICASVPAKVWDQDLHEGSTVRIKYLPDKPNYVIRI